MRILVVEDDPALARMIELALILEDHEVRWARNGAEALTALAAAPADLILLDMVMPEVDGWEFAARYRAAPGPHVPIVTMSATVDVVQAAQAMGAQGYLVKPFELNELLQRVRELAQQTAA
jgi:DNA-binding response OmpR family regulator